MDDVRTDPALVAFCPLLLLAFDLGPRTADPTPIDPTPITPPAPPVTGPPVPRFHHVIALCVLALLTLGVVMVNSADMAIAPVRGNAPPPPAVTPASILLSKSTIYMGLALLAMLVASLFPVRHFASVAVQAAAGGSRRLGFRSLPFSPSGPGGLGSLVPAHFLLFAGAGVLLVLLTLVYAPIIGREVNGSRRWIGLPIPGLRDALSVQPSELAKWFLIPLLAFYCTALGGLVRRFWLGLVPALACVGLIAGMVIVEDLGTGALIAAVACFLLVAGGARLWQFMLFVPVGVAAIVAAILTSPYRVKRIMAFLDPYADPEKTGYHMIQSMLAVHNGSGFGRGLGHGLQKFGYLPEDRTDFLFAVLCEELGVAGAALVVALLSGILLASLAIARREENPLLKLLTLGVAATVGLQAIINMAVVTGLGPTKGIALPLVSSGGTGWILTAFFLGLVIAASRTQPAFDEQPGSVRAAEA
ncbi:MAG: FtsW/RodA/SpoVE family cell cycle protein [Planctomycetota bacterium]|nr:FtsW/RodA/SpoVE family cell cycle protein [Planctomycetota bacterium]